MDERCSDCCVFKSDALLSSASPGQSRANERWASIHEAVTPSLCRGKEAAGYIVVADTYRVSTYVGAAHETRPTRSPANTLINQTISAELRFVSSERAPG